MMKTIGAHMAGVIVTWDTQEIQAIDEGNFESTVVDVVDGFFTEAPGYSEVTVEWTPAKGEGHDSVYKVSEKPLTHLDRSRCFIDITGQQRGGEYQIDLRSSGFYIKTKSSGHIRELSFLRLRGPGLQINAEEEELILEEIPERIKKRLVNIVR